MIRGCALLWATKCEYMLGTPKSLQFTRISPVQYARSNNYYRAINLNQRVVDEPKSQKQTALISALVESNDVQVFASALPATNNVVTQDPMQ